MDFAFNEEQKMLRKTVQEFVNRDCPRELVRKLDEKDEFPRQLFEKLADMGITGIGIPEEYGGQGGDITDVAIMTEELSKRYPALSWVLGLSLLYGGDMIYRSGSEQQKKFYLPKIAKGELLFSFALTEPDAGSDAANQHTTAVRDGDNYIINGTKIFITGGYESDFIMTMTRTDKPKYKGLTYFLVSTESKGFNKRKLDKLGYKGSSACELVYDNVAVPEENILGGPEGLNNGWKYMVDLLNDERVLLAAGGLGIAEAAYEDALQYAKERVQFGQPIGKFQAIAHMLVEMATKIEAARLLTYEAAWLITQNMPYAKECSMAKYYATEIAKEVSLQGLQIFGGYGYMMDCDMQRYVRDAILLPIGGGTTEIEKNIIASMIGL